MFFRRSELPGKHSSPMIAQEQIDVRGTLRRPMRRRSLPFDARFHVPHQRLLFTGKEADIRLDVANDLLAVD